MPAEATPFIFSGLLFCVLSAYSWRNRSVPGMRIFTLLMLADAWWVVTYAMDLASSTVADKMFWLQIKYLGSLPSGVLWLCLTLELTGHKNWLHSRWFQSLAILPLTLLVIVLTNSWHGWFWREVKVVEGVIDSVTVHGPAFAWYANGSLLLALISLVFMLRHTVTTVPFYRRRNLWLLAGFVCPYLGWLTDLSWLSPIFSRVDPVPLMLVPSSLFMAMALFRYRAMDIVPLAQRMVFENMDAAALVVDANQRVVAVNQSAEQLWPDAAPGMTYLNELLPAQTLSAAPVGEAVEYFHKPQQRWYLVMVSELANRREGNLGFALMLVDITARREAEEARLQMVEARTKFVATVSHELRSPLHATTGLLDMTLSTPLSSQQRRYLSQAKHSTNMLMSLVNNVLDQSRIDAGKMPLERIPMDLQALVDQLQAVHGFSAQEKGLQLNFDVDNLGTMIMGDPLRLNQILTNLISNALKFTDHGSVDVLVHVEEDQGHTITLQFAVVDTGIGMTSLQLDGLFQPFSQAAQSTPRNFGGTGLGLSIAQSLVHSMGGQIKATSQPGRGSSFQFSLEFVVAEDTQAALDQVTNRSLLHVKILAVDDSPINLEILENQLLPTGAQLHTAAQGADGLHAAMAEEFNIVFLDVHMPQLDGLEMVRQLRDIPGYEHTPVLAMSASVLPEDRARAHTAGFDGFLDKPFGIAQILNALDEHLGAATGFGKSPAPQRAASTEALVHGIDVAWGVTNLADDRAKHFNLLHRFVSESRSEMAGLVEHSPDSGRVIHRLLGTAHMLGTVDLVAALSKVQKNLAGGQDVDVAMTAVEGALTEIEQYLIRFSPQPTE